jgi:hypothetical protein
MVDDYWILVRSGRFKLGGPFVDVGRCECRKWHPGSGGEGVFADDAADPVAAMDTEAVEISDCCR